MATPTITAGSASPASVRAPTRNTRQKDAIRHAFEQSGRPLSPEEILTAAQQQVDGLSLATVYRNINALVEDRWLSSVNVPGEPPRYEIAGKGHHHHFHCTVCGRIYDLAGCALPLAPELPAGFHLTGHELFLYGRCPVCVESVA
jgi:Fur family ferric uptake transcriptional regulator